MDELKRMKKAGFHMSFVSKHTGISHQGLNSMMRGESRKLTEGEHKKIVALCDKLDRCGFLD